MRVALQNKARLRRLDLYCKFGKQMDGLKERQSDKSERVMEMEGGQLREEERFSRWRGKTWKSSRIRSNEHVARAEEKSFPSLEMMLLPWHTKRP